MRQVLLARRRLLTTMNHMRQLRKVKRYYRTTHKWGQYNLLKLTYNKHYEFNWINERAGTNYCDVFIINISRRTMMPVARKARHYVFTLNNPTYPEMVAFDNQCVKLTVPVIDYMIRGYEGFGKDSTPHIQGAVCFCKPVTWRQAKEYLGPRVHLEQVKTLFSSAVYYCMKEGDFKEFGNVLTAIAAKYPHLQTYVSEKDECFDPHWHFEKEITFLRGQEELAEYRHQQLVKELPKEKLIDEEAHGG